MPREYSHGACLTCKRRKKKCNEGKPSCSACLRMSLNCCYEEPPLQRSGNRSRYRNFTQPALIERIPKVSPIQGEIENDIIFRMEQATHSFYTPASSDKTRDLSVLWQMVMTDSLVCNTVVAFFSAVLCHTPQHGQLNRRAYGSALRLLCDRIALPDPDSGDQLAMRASICFLGHLDCASPENPSKVDLTRHWRALARLFLKFEPELAPEPSSTTFSLDIQILEGFVYNTSCLALFSSDVEGISHLWQQTQVMNRLEGINCEGPERIANSPLLSGEYRMYEVVLEVTRIHRSAATALPREAHIEALISHVNRLDVANKVRFTDNTFIGTALQARRAMRDIYRCLAGALSICLYALQGNSKLVRDLIDSTVSENLNRLISLPRIPMCLAALMWPIHIFACAIRYDNDFDVLVSLVAELGMYLHPGHRRRLISVVETVQRLRESTYSLERHREVARNTPIGFSLLQKPGGVLS